MEQIIASVCQAILAKNFHVALFTSLTLPDICGKIMAPHLKAGDRYRAWWVAFVSHYYVSERGDAFLNARDAYALRCAILHEGSDKITSQQAREILENFTFVASSETQYLHCNRWGGTLQLDVATYCAHICDGVERWMFQQGDRAHVSAGLAGIFAIQQAA